MKNLSSIIHQAGFRTLSPFRTPVKMAYDLFETHVTDLQAPPLIVMHGLMGSKKSFNTTCKHIHNATKRKIFNLDARNHGESPHAEEHTAKAMASDIAHLMESHKIKQAALMGHSMGGRAMMFFTLKYPNLVDKAIFVDISPIAIPRQFRNVDRFFIILSKLQIPSKLTLAQARNVVGRKLMESIDNKTTIDFILMNLKKTKSGEFIWTVNIKAIRAHFSDILQGQEFNQTPFPGSVMFICGRKSNFLNPTDWPKIKTIFPNAELQWLDSGHLIHIDKAEKFQELVSKFLNK